MLIKASALKGYKLKSLDGEIGKVKEFYFDDQHWAIRYLIADTGSWLSDRKVLISPYALESVLEEDRLIGIHLTKKQIMESPFLGSDKSVSMQFEESFYMYYGWPSYSNGPYMWGAYPYIVRDPDSWNEPAQGEKKWDTHLRSTHEVMGYHIQAEDDTIGHVEDFIIDDDTWAIRYMVIDTKNWWSGKKVLISPHWIKQISWIDSNVIVNMTCEIIRMSPEYEEDTQISRDYEDELHRYYNFHGYWDDKPMTGILPDEAQI